MDATTPRLTAAAPEGVATVDTPRPATAAPRDLAGRGAGRWRPVADALDLPPAVEQAMAARAAINGTTFAAELLASGAVSEQAFYGAVARVLALPFLDEVDADALVMRERDGLAALRLRDGVRTARLHVPSGQSLILIAPDEREFGRLRGLLADRPDLAARLRIVTPRALRRAVEQRCQRALLQRATHALFDVLPACSARIVMKGRQGFLAGALVGLYAALFFVASGEATLAVHVFFSLFFMACVVLRLLAVRRGPPQPSPTFSALRPKQMPRYSVLVALYREAEIVPELLVALGRLVWPRGKLEIKLVCEADDADTIAAIRAQDLRPLVEVIEVPKSAPRTKPKALAYALQMVTGDYVALYDAEDRPHPFQLVEAWQRFEDAWPDLACVQAPLAISNRDRGLLARMFAFEYSGLFNGMLPFLSRNELVLPLGGTSNHFPPRHTGGDRRLGPVQRHRGRRSRPAPAPPRLPHRDDLAAHLGGGAGDARRMAAAAHPLVQGLDPDLAGPHARSAPALFGAGRGLVHRLADPVRRHGGLRARPPAASRHHLLSRAGAARRRPFRHLSFGPARPRRRQHRARLCGLPAARRLDPARAREAPSAADRAVHAGLLDAAVGRRLAGALAALPGPASVRPYVSKAPSWRET